MTTQTPNAPALPVVGGSTCANCVHVRTFKPRPDEQARYDFGSVGYGCQKRGYEGYTQPFSSCSFFARAALARTGEAK